MKFLKTSTSVAMKSACSYNSAILSSQVQKWKRILFSASLSCISNLGYISGFSYVGGVDSYQKSTWSLGENYIKEYNDWFLEQQTEFLLGRYQMVLMALSCFGLFIFSNMLTIISKIYIHPLWPYKLCIVVN